MDSEAISAVREMFSAIDKAVPRDQTSQTTRARNLFTLLGHDGGQVEPVDEPEFTRTRLEELGTWSDDPWPGPTYGVDASTTRPLEYNNGLVVDTAYAKTAVAGDDGNRSIERSGQITGVVYYDDDDSTLHSQSFDGEFVNAELVPFPESAEEAKNVEKSVATVAQRQSESRQALASLNDVDGALFLDGAVLPLGIVYWVLLDYAGERAPAGSWDKPAEILSNYIEILDRQYERNQPVIGIVKTSSMSQVLSALRKKITQNNIRDENDRQQDVPWVRDHQFFAEVLRHDDLDYLTYSSWFTHKQQRIDGQHYELLEPMAETLRHGSPAKYRRAFCFVRLPKTGDVLRIETPALFVQDDEMREQVRLKALKEIAQRRGVPRAIDRADRLARITQQNRSTIRDMLESSESSFDHNWDGRWSALDDDNPNL
jgi:hypothetical protein